MSVDVYQNNFFSNSYRSKRLLHDAVERTSGAYEVFFHSPSIVNALMGIVDIIVARIESALAFVFMAASSIYFIFASIILSPCYLAFNSLFYLLSFILQIFSVESAHEAAKQLSNEIYRVLRVNLITIPAIILFLTAAAINILPFPGISEIVNLFFYAINGLVECLGPLISVRVTVPGQGSFDGTKEQISILTEAEEFLRALSTKNYLKEQITDGVLYHYPGY